MTVVLGTVIHVEYQRVNLAGLFELGPKGLKSIDDEVCRDFALGEVEVRIVMLGEEEAEKTKDNIWIEVMVYPIFVLAAIPSSRERAHLDSCFRIQ